MYKKIIGLIYQIKEQKGMLHNNLLKIPNRHPQYTETVTLIRRMEWEIKSLQKLIKGED